MRLLKVCPIYSLQSFPEADYTDDHVCFAKVSDITNGAIYTNLFQHACLAGGQDTLDYFMYMNSQWTIGKSLQGNVQGL